MFKSTSRPSSKIGSSVPSFDDPFFQKEGELVPLKKSSIEQEDSTKLQKPYKRKRFGWAFMVASTMLGVGLTASTSIPVFVLGGIGLGFLFFVHPIHDRVVDLLGGKAYREQEKLLEQENIQEDQKYLP